MKAPPLTLPPDYAILDGLATSFLRSLRAAGKAARTMQMYLDVTRRFVAFLAARGMPSDPSAIRREHVETYLLHIADTTPSRTGGPVSVNTLRSHYNSQIGRASCRERV